MCASLLGGLVIPVVDPPGRGIPPVHVNPPFSVSLDLPQLGVLLHPEGFSCRVLIILLAFLMHSLCSDTTNTLQAPTC